MLISRQADAHLVAVSLSREAQGHALADGCLLLLLPILLRQIFPVADGHVLTLLARVHAFADADGLEVGAPQFLEELLVLVEQGLVELARLEVRQLLVEVHTGHLPTVVIVTVVPASVIEQKGLVGKTVAEMVDGKRKNIVERFHECKIGAVGCFLEADELEHAQPFVCHLAAGIGDEEHVRVGKVALDALRGVDGLADVTEEGHVQLRQFGEVGGGKAGEGLVGELLAEGIPDAGGFCLVGDDGVFLLVEQGEGDLVSLQDIGEGAARIGIKDCRQESVEGAVEAENRHGSRGVGEVESPKSSVS